MTTDTLANGLKAVFGSTNNIQSSSLIPYADSNRNPAGFTDMSKLASALGGFLLKADTNVQSTNVDWNTLTTFGIYTHAGMGSAVGLHVSPVSNNMGMLVVFGYASNRVVQVDISISGIAARQYNGEWTEWKSTPFS